LGIELMRKWDGFRRRIREAGLEATATVIRGDIFPRRCLDATCAMFLQDRHTMGGLRPQFETIERPDKRMFSTVEPAGRQARVMKEKVIPSVETQSDHKS